MVASPGYFKIDLQNGVRAEMTSSRRTNLYRFSFFRTDSHKLEENGATEDEQLYNPLVLLDLTDLMKSRSNGTIQVNPESGMMSGYGTFRPSFGQGSYKAFFCVEFRGAPIGNTGTFRDGIPSESTQKLVNLHRGVVGSVGAWVHFEHPETDDLLARVGMSFISEEKACLNAVDEVPGFDFERTVQEAQDAWSEKLSVVQLNAGGVSDELQTTFWSGLYRSFLMPENYTGENPLWDSEEPYFDSFYCIWDSFRAQHPLLTIIDPEAQREIIRSLLDIYRHSTHLPDCRMSFSKGFTQVRRTKMSAGTWTLLPY